MITSKIDETLLTAKQVEAVFHLSKQDRGIAWWRVGEGKTRIALAWIFAIVDVPLPLVICSPQAFRQWLDEISLMHLEGILKPVFFSAGMLSHKNGIDALNRLLRTATGINCIVIDELWMFKNVKAQRTMIVHQVSRQLPCIGLSGSMVTARNIEDLYGQAFAMGLDQKVARNLTEFRKEFCIEVQNRFTGYVERYPKRKAVIGIQERLKDYVHIWFPKEMREIRDITVNVDPTPQQLKFKRELIKEYYIEHTEGESTFRVEVKSATALLSKLQQISDGFIYDMDGGSLSIPSSKMQRLQQHCAELCYVGEKVLVWCAFRQTIVEALKASSMETVVLSGDNEFDANKWKQDKPVVCYATIGSGSSLNDFANVRYAVIYSSNYSHRAMQQAKGRTNRKSTLHSCCYYYWFQTVGFPDAKVYEALSTSANAEESVINITRRIIGEWLLEQKLSKSLQNS